jgi:hypothetical protein
MTYKRCNRKCHVAAIAAVAVLVHVGRLGGYLSGHLTREWCTELEQPLRFTLDLCCCCCAVFADVG